jgi:hypothetical protein
MTPQQVLLAAADLLERDGWCQEFERGGKHCAYSAILFKSPVNDSLNTALTACAMVSRSVGEWITYWNDAPGQTAENVISTLRKAAST